MTPSDLTLGFPAGRVEELASSFSYPRDDGEFLEIGRRVRERGRYTREELIAVCEWKTSRSRRWVARNTDEDVKFVTGEALGSDDERTRMSTLRWLWGVDVPSASAILSFVFPEQYPILDVRALESLGHKTSRTIYPTDFWVDYLFA